jgi:hypothetical protein
MDICVKYAQCVKIWSFDVLVLFLKCVLFLKSCVQFLMDIVLNLTIVQFLMKKKGDAHFLRVSLIGGKGRRALAMRVSHRSQRETHYIGAHLPFT